MAYTLVVNPGSTSKKYALFAEGRPVLEMRFERTELGLERCTEIDREQQKCEGVTQEAYEHALAYFLEYAVTQKIISSNMVIERVAVRVVAPGSLFQTHIRITDVVIHKLRDAEASAPLHIPFVLAEIETVRKRLPTALLICISDSAFHHEMPKHARQYSIPSADAAHYDLYRFGYHGLSVASVIRRAPQVIGRQPEKTIVCHIGGGVSVTAVAHGKSIDTSMGYAPTGGLMMGSRAGDIDSGALLTLMRLKNMHPLDAQNYIQTHGGLRGVADESDLRLIIDRSSREDVSATLALEMFVYRIQLLIGAYLAIMPLTDTIICTGTAGERSSILRQLIFQPLAHLGISINEEKNNACHGADALLTHPTSKIQLVVMKTNEMEEMCLEAERF